MALPAEIARLIETFDQNRDTYRQSPYNETQVRREFIDPFFRALGWDIDNTSGWAEAYKDVIHEDAIRVGQATKAPDYCFRIGGTRKFFLEAKKPAVDIKGDPGPAYQLRRYAWSAKLPLSILTDFEEFAVYDCRVRPNKTDKPSKARIMYLSYDQYAEHWDEIAAIFSRDAVLKGSFDKYAISEKRKRGTAEVDTAFLAEIEHWRDVLARNMALRNKVLTNRQLNFAVQITIDRIIFMRICEDRGIETHGQLLSLLNGRDVYQRLMEVFRKADGRYNSGLFHFEREKGRTEGVDELTPELVIDDKLLKDIIRSLYYPDSPYEFSVLPAEILGQVYEQFLGKVITLTAGHHARVEDKPEVKKAGGVYYTPAYIVDYIVKHTVGKLLEGCSVKFLKTKPPRLDRPLRVLDPACGSGSFLLGAYQALLDWYRDYYINNEPEKWASTKNPPIYQSTRYGWKLTTAERKRILLDHIYGVDIDTQAVEVTKLSLLLKVLEGENQDSIDAQLRLFHERVLPDLASNIKCGNSLIGPDFYQGQQFAMFDQERQFRVNAFNWEAEFPDAFRDKGFDVVVGNPPWLMAGYHVQESLDYLHAHYRSAERKFDLYYVFVEAALGLARREAYIGMIIPNKFFHTSAASSLRALLSETRYVRSLVDFGLTKVFQGATNYSCVVLMEKSEGQKLSYTRSDESLVPLESFHVQWSVLGSTPWNFVPERISRVFAKLECETEPLGPLVARFGAGVQTGADRILILSQETVAAERVEQQLLRPILKGRDVRRYCANDPASVVMFPYEASDHCFRLLSEEELLRYPVAQHYLLKHKGALARRLWFGKNAAELSGNWYGLMYLDSPDAFAREHILTPCLSNGSNFSMGRQHLFVTGTAGVTSIIPGPAFTEDLRYLLGLLNSTLLDLYATRHSPQFSGGYYKFTGPYLRKLPIRRADVGVSSEKSFHDRMVEMVQGMLDWHQALAAAKTPDEKEMLKRQVDATDRQIDQLVYELYGLSDEEIRIVEDAVR